MRGVGFAALIVAVSIWWFIYDMLKDVPNPFLTGLALFVLGWLWIALITLAVWITKGVYGFLRSKISNFIYVCKWKLREGKGME